MGRSVSALRWLTLLGYSTLQAASQSTPSNGGDTYAECERSVIKIVWSCLAVIFACTWVSVHPNVPGSKEKALNVVLRKLSIMVDALVAPELVLFWAMRQWIGSRIIAARYRAHGWTKTHGFFLLMGGFVLEEPNGGSGDKAMSPLDPQRFHRLLVEGQIDFPDILEADIEDHSKADWLAKLVVILQVTWFIVQCIARGVSSEPDLTELEVVTLAFATLNAAMYFFWWNKPLDVKRAIRIPLKQGMHCKCPLQRGDGKEKDQATVIEQAASNFESLSPPETAMNVLEIWAVVEKINKIPLVNLVSKPVTALVWCQDHMIPQNPTRVPTFYSPTLPNPMSGALAMMVISAAGVLFGAVHFIGWNIKTPTAIEQLIWRISTVAITATFAVNAINTSVLVIKLYHRPRLSEHSAKTPLPIRVLEVLVGAVEILTVPFYIIGRLCLFGLAFATLRNLPTGARKEIVWTSYLPHI